MDGSKSLQLCARNIEELSPKNSFANQTLDLKGY